MSLLIYTRLTVGFTTSNDIDRAHRVKSFNTAGIIRVVSPMKRSEVNETRSRLGTSLGRLEGLILRTGLGLEVLDVVRCQRAMVSLQTHAYIRALYYIAFACVHINRIDCR